MDIVEIINQIEEDKKARNTVPAHARFLEIVNIHGNRDEAGKELNRLYAENKVKIGDTVNDKYIKLV